MHTELLAQLVEEVSLLATDQRRTEHRLIARPYPAPSDSAVPQGNSAPAQQEPPMNGHRKMLAAATRRGMVHPNA